MEYIVKDWKPEIEHPEVFMESLKLFTKFLAYNRANKSDTFTFVLEHDQYRIVKKTISEYADGRAITYDCSQNIERSFEADFFSVKLYGIDMYFIHNKNTGVVDNQGFLHR
jgi:hypothetical protein